MKIFKLISSGIYTVLLFSMLLSKVVSADELLKLGSFNVNDLPSYGENIVVVQDDQDSLKGISGVTDKTGKITIPIILSTGEFEFTVEVFDAGVGDISFFFTLGELNLTFDLNVASGIVSLEKSGSAGNSSLWLDNGKNEVRLKVSNGIAQLFVNDVFITKVTLENDKANVLYNTLIVTNIDDKHIIRSMTLTNGISGSKFAAELSRDVVDLHIPQINYDAVEGSRPLWADLRLFPNREGKILFEVIDFGDYPK